MILDNKNENPKVHEWISQNTSNGNMDIVTGYFTIGALAFLSEQTNEKVNHYRFMIGDIVSSSEQKIAAINLLNENLTLETAFELKSWAQKAANFLRQNKIECKTLEPNFCHAKLYMTESESKNPVQSMYIMGSSNLTEAGIGLKTRQNVELNTAGTGTESIYTELKKWFNDLWESKQAHNTKTIIDLNGKQMQVNFKQYLIDEISRIFKIYEPIDIYNKVLFELFNQDTDPEFQKDLGKLENTIIYKKLYGFQQNGVVTLIKMLNKYDGALLADAVGLGKTWSTLAIIKFFENKGLDTLLICPKKLEQNWKQYLKRENSIFENDNFDYHIKFHTDFTERSVELDRLNLDYLQNGKPKLVVIDESHNLRNNKSIKYKILLEEILQKCKGNVKVLLLSATPINNSFKDVRNQFALMTKGQNDGYKESLDIQNLEYVFRQVQREFNLWNANTDNNLHDFYQKVKQNDFFKLTDSLVVARTRSQIKSHFDEDIHFPKVQKPQNIFKTPLNFGDFDDLGDMMEKLKLNLSAYQPSQFTLTLKEIENKQKQKDEKNKEKNKGKKDSQNSVLTDNLQREYFLVKMMKILMLKRLESSWKAFQHTVDNIYNHHQGAIDKINKYKETKKEETIANLSYEDTDDEAFESALEKIELGKKNPIKLSEIDKAGRLDDFKDEIVRDKDNLLIIKNNLSDFEKAFNKDHKKDIKLVELIQIIEQKQKLSNKKIVIFTAYKDTAAYLFQYITAHLKVKTGLVHGGNAMLYSSENNIPIQTLLQHFAPYTKLFLEKNWADFYAEKSTANFVDWKEWLKENDLHTHGIVEQEVDVLITTDVLSEGQNLQDADMVVNYDIHWNPVRVIQRFGRIDRIGSPNETIQCINFWPTDSIDKYIKLKSRVVSRMAVMQFIGSEVIQDFTPEFAEIAENPLENRQTENLLRQFENTLDEIDGEKSIGFDDFSFDIYKQQLLDKLNEKQRELASLPNGIFSGCCLNENQNLLPGIIALLGLKPIKEGKYLEHSLVYLNENGEVISDNTKVVLDVLNQLKSFKRKVPHDLDTGQKEALQKYQNILLKWVEKLSIEIEILPDGTEKQSMGTAHLDLLNKFKKGSVSAINELKLGTSITEKYAKDNFDLITWFIVS